MLSRSTIVLSGFILLVYSSMSHAEQHQDSASKRISFVEAINKTLEFNPSLRTFSYELKAQSGRQLQAAMSASPEVSFVVEDGLGTGEFSGSDNAQATLSIGWLLEGSIRQGFVDVASANMFSLNAEQHIKRLDEAAETARLYIICLAYQARMENAAKTVTLAQQTVSAVKKRAQAGRAAQAELARAQAEHALRELELEDMQHELSSAIRLLAAQWGEQWAGTHGSFNQVEGDIFDLPEIISYEMLKKQLEQSPEFRLLLTEKRLKQAQLDLANSQSSSAWKLNLGVRHFQTSGDQALVAGISIPFGERSRNSGAIAAARENLSQTQAKEDELRLRYETTLYVLSQELEHNQHRMETYRKDIIPQLEKALKQTRRAYELGRYSYFEWHSLQAELLNARSALVEAGIDVHLKVIEIERLTGMRMTQAVIK